MTKVDHKSDYELTKSTKYLMLLMGELSNIYLRDFLRNYECYNETVLQLKNMFLAGS